MNPFLTTWFLVFTRVGAMLAILPMFSTQVIPRNCASRSARWWRCSLRRCCPSCRLTGCPLWSLAKLMFMEVSVGLLLGFVCRFVFYALEIAGGFIATEMGLTLPQEFTPLISVL